MQTELVAVTRTGKGKEAAKKLRRSGLIPAVLYGHRFEPLHLALKERTFLAALRRERGLHGLVKLRVEDAEDGEHTVLVKEVQRDPLKDHILHVDLQKVHADEELQATVSLHFTGEAAGVKAGGILNHYLYEVRVQCLPKDLPEFIEVDVSHLNLKESLRVADLPRLEGIKYLNKPEEIVAAVTPKRVREAARTAQVLFETAPEEEAAAGVAAEEEGPEAEASAPREEGEAEAGESSGE
ncbi:50S ribosomal protein L25 [Candidatus Solincola sp.]|nr:50S ribosomal protein L25 [Actinomycetota bacterium]MDI7251007.1 50S ribosomal protein L25 [Actinomycetota bacterium]